MYQPHYTNHAYIKSKRCVTSQRKNKFIYLSELIAVIVLQKRPKYLLPLVSYEVEQWRTR